ncbi:unnamed protein product [Closterium sp. NIES-65]|nr:unnamed protein product [Closterium sp. NIES-65]
MDRISLPSPLSHSLASPRARLGPWLLPPDRRTVAATFNGVNGADRDNSVNRVSGVNGVNRVSQVSRNSDRDSLIPSRFFTSLSSRASLCAKSHVFLRQSACASPRPSPCLSASPSASIWASTSCAHPGEETLRRPGAPRGGAGRIGAPLAGLQLRAALPLVARAEGGGEAGVIAPAPSHSQRVLLLLPPPGHSPAYAFPPSSPAAGPAPTRDTGTLLIRLYNRYDYDLARHHPELQTVVGVDPSAHHMLHCLLPSLPCLRISPTLFTSPLQLCQHHPELETVEGVHVGPSAHAIAADFASLHSFASALSCALSHFVSPLQLCQRHPELQTVVGVDVDPAAHAIAAARLHPFLRIAAPPGAKAARPQDLHAHGQAAAPVAECGQPEAHGQATLRAVETPEATLRVAEERRATATLHVVEGNFRRMVEACAGVGVGRGSVDGILLDVGVSSMQVRAGSVEVASDAGGGVLWHVRAWHVGVLSTQLSLCAALSLPSQIDRAERGFSFLRDGPLDMRMDPKSPLTAEVAVNNWPEEVLGQILRDLGEERRWQQIARRIVEARGRGRISTTTQLAAIVAGGAYGPKKSTASSSRRGGPGMRIHPATRTFQALRIAVNDELAALALAIPAALSLLAPGGRLAVISFHSLEDRIVKRSFLEAAAGVPVPMPVPVPLPVAMPVPVSAPGVGSSSGLEGHGHARYRVVTKRPVVAEEDEWRVNARSRSAKLRVVERVA